MSDLWAAGQIGFFHESNYGICSQRIYGLRVERKEERGEIGLEFVLIRVGDSESELELLWFLIDKKEEN